MAGFCLPADSQNPCGISGALAGAGEVGCGVSRVVPEPLFGARPVKYERREVVNAILYVPRVGVAWHDLPQ